MLSPVPDAPLPEACSDGAKAPWTAPSEIISPSKNKNQKEQLFSSGILSQRWEVMAHGKPLANLAHCPRDFSCCTG